MAAIEVTPAGNHLYEARIQDGEGESTHQVTVPDDIVSRMDTEGVSMRDVVTAAVEFLAGREDRETLDDHIDLAEAARRYDDFLALIPSRARELATVPDAQLTPDDEPAPPTGDERLRQEVDAEQREGDATPPDPRL